jgi:hypothetical protein
MGLLVEIIDAPDGEEPLPVMVITSMPPGLATIWARGTTCLPAVVKVHQEAAGFAAISAL